MNSRLWFCCQISPKNKRAWRVLGAVAWLWCEWAGNLAMYALRSFPIMSACDLSNNMTIGPYFWQDKAFDSGIAVSSYHFSQNKSCFLFILRNCWPAANPVLGMRVEKPSSVALVFPLFLRIQGKKKAKPFGSVSSPVASLHFCFANVLLYKIQCWTYLVAMLLEKHWKNIDQ